MKTLCPHQEMVETMDEVEEVGLEVSRNIWVRRDIFRSEVGEGEEGTAEPAACVGGGGEETQDHRPHKSREDGDDGEDSSMVIDHAGEETGGDVCVEEKKKKKMMKCRLCGENVPDDVELQQLHEKYYHHQEVIDVSDGEDSGQKLDGRAEDGQDGEGEEGAGREGEPPETAQLSRSGRKMRKISCSCCK